MINETAIGCSAGKTTTQLFKTKQKKEENEMEKSFSAVKSQALMKDRRD